MKASQMRGFFISFGLKLNIIDFELDGNPNADLSGKTFTLC